MREIELTTSSIVGNRIFNYNRISIFATNYIDYNFTRNDVDIK